MAERKLWTKIIKLFQLGVQMPAAMVETMLHSMPNYLQRSPGSLIVIDCKAEKYLSLLTSAYAKGATQNIKYY